MAAGWTGKLTGVAIDRQPGMAQPARQRMAAGQRPTWTPGACHGTCELMFARVEQR